MVYIGNYKDKSKYSDFIDVEVQKISPSNSPYIVGNAVLDFKTNIEDQCGMICQFQNLLGLRQPFHLVDAYITDQLWRVDGASNGRSYFKSDGLRPLIIEQDKGTLYIFRNGDFYYWRHTDFGKAYRTHIDINLDNLNLRQYSRKPTVRYNVEFIKEKFEEKDIKFFEGRFVFHQHLCNRSGENLKTPNLQNKLLFADTCSDPISIELPGANQFFGASNKNDHIRLGAGNVIIAPNGGNDYIELSPGADIVVISTASYKQNDLKIIKNFQPDDGDILDLRHLIEFKTFEPHNLTVVQNHIELRSNNNDIEVWVDPDSSHTEHSRKHVVTLKGLLMDKPNTLLSNGSIVYFD